MTTFLFSFLLTVGADRVALTDPHGLTLTVTSICVVFCALIILYFVYSLSGVLFSGKLKPTKKSSADKSARQDRETAAAIALALSEECGQDVSAAIALAIHLHSNDGIHDEESGAITITDNNTGWSDKSLTLRRKPNKQQ